MAAGRVQHWKHGWIPVSPEARAFVAGTGPNPTAGSKTIRQVGKVGPTLQKEIEDNGGFTYDPKKNKILTVGKDRGFAVAIPGTETIVGEEKVNGDDVTRESFARGVADVIMKHGDAIAKGAKIGGWYSPERNAYMVELTQIHDPEDRAGAIQLGKDRNQEAIFDLSTGETIMTGGTGDGPPKNLALRSTPPNRLNGFTVDPTPEETAAAKYYTGPGFRPLNTKLRTGEAPPPPPGSVGHYMRQLDALLDASVTTKDATVYRGLTTWPGFPDTMAPGTTYSDRGYMSTAISDGPPDNYQGNVEFSIHVPAGSHALDLNGNQLSHHPEERELLLPHGSQFRVLSDVVRPTDGKRLISMELTQ